MKNISKLRYSSAVLTLLLGAALLAGCEGDAVGTSANASTSADTHASNGPTTGELEALFEQVESGEAFFVITGAVTSLDEHTLANDPSASGVSRDIFRPALGGGNSRSGNNANGPYSLTLYTDALHEEAPDNPVQAWLNLILPEDAEAGRYYAINTFADAEADQVQAHLLGDGRAWTFERQVEGGLQLFELGETISAAWHLTAAAGHGEESRRVNVEGAVNDLLFTPQSQTNYDIEINGDNQQVVMRTGGNARADRYTLVISNGIYLNFPAGIEPGSYSIELGRDDGVVGIQFTQHNIESVEGTLILTQHGETFDAEIEFSASGEDKVALSGTLEALTLVQ